MVAVFTVDTVEIAIAYAIELDRVSLIKKYRMFNGVMRTAMTSDAAVARTWGIQTDRLTLAVADALEVTLKAPGTVSVAGDALGETVVCRAASVGRQDGPLSDQAALRFQLHEVTP